MAADAGEAGDEGEEGEEESEGEGVEPTGDIDFGSDDEEEAAEDDFQDLLDEEVDE